MVKSVGCRIRFLPFEPVSYRMVCDPHSNGAFIRNYSYCLLSLLLPGIQPLEATARWGDPFSSCWTDTGGIQTSSLLFLQTDCTPPKPDGLRCTVPASSREDGGRYLMADGPVNHI